MPQELIRTVAIRKYFAQGAGFLGGKRRFEKAVDGVDLEILKGDAVGLVGESGCGKTTLGMLVAGLINPTEGNLLYRGKNLLKMRGHEAKLYRRKVQIVFQDAESSLDPTMNVAQIIREPLDVYKVANRIDRVKELAKDVGIEPDLLTKRPHELSGGQKQRVAIGRALALEPEVVVFDEPTSSLDVSVQGQILNLIMQRRKEMGLSYLFISHELAVVRNICEKVYIMYAGKIVEYGLTESLFSKPLHPYSEALLSAIPSPDPKAQRLSRAIVLTGDVPSAANYPDGCRFHPR
jgi:oligopeptide/dipeptide ABC transporter ATP-binding protein